MAIERQFELNEQLLECRSKVAQMAVELKEARAEVKRLHAVAAEAREEGIDKLRDRLLPYFETIEKEIIKEEAKRLKEEKL